MEKNAPTDVPYLRVLGHLFTELDNNALRNILEVGEKHQIELGDYLFRQGDRENSLYIVLCGRLRVVMQDKKGTHILGDIGQGEPTGEFSLFTDEPRMASVIAIRKTTVLQITRQQYLTLVSQNPAFASIVTRFLIKRLQRHILEQHTSVTTKNIALINLQADYDLSPWTLNIEKTFEESGTRIQIFNHDTIRETRYHVVFDSLEHHEGLNILVCSETDLEWSRRCLLYADLVIVATDFLADPNLYPIEKLLGLYTHSILNKKIYLVFLHQNETALPQHTSCWLEQRSVNLHIHVRKDHLADIRRFCRIISNQAVGVVLGGGGAKGFAHMGALRALLEAGVEIDFLGGTSAGALYGIAMSHCDFDFQKVDVLCKDAAKRRITSNDYSWPIVSIMSGKKITRFMKDLFQDSKLEDIWVNSYCVSTNFSTSATKVHKTGLIWKMVQASIAIPGVLPPVVIDKQLHVDGSVVDNLPIEPMYRYPVRHIIAISLSGQNPKDVDYAETPSAGKLIWDKFMRKKRYRIPGIVSLIVNSITLNSRQKQENTKTKVSLYLEMDLKGVGFLDNKRWGQTIKKGHDQMKSFLENLPEKEKFWLKKHH